ncbi:DNA-directed RNA polymerase [Candidatus Bathyarchaeota archaeon]|nr:DNA-directed RNA polymerase [Candidatus Bathyarchaeota archaeon]NIV43945.1 DNA-directed RNA polymerase [Candidatus Bathyarchaeota archaeon]
MHEVGCAVCDQECAVPFKHDFRRPVFCRVVRQRKDD